jgi:hypothetical protein
MGLMGHLSGLYKLGLSFYHCLSAISDLMFICIMITISFEYLNLNI